MHHSLGNLFLGHMGRSGQMQLVGSKAHLVPFEFRFFTVMPAGCNASLPVKAFPGHMGRIRQMHPAGSKARLRTYPAAKLAL